jgi:hypothetical protein
MAIIKTPMTTITAPETVMIATNGRRHPPCGTVNAGSKTARPRTDDDEVIAFLGRDFTLAKADSTGELRVTWIAEDDVRPNDGYGPAGTASVR